MAHLGSFSAYAQSLSGVQLFSMLWTVALQAPLSMGFPRHEYWSGLPFSRDLPNPGIEPISLMSPALAGRFSSTSTTWEALQSQLCYLSTVGESFSFLLLKMSIILISPT